MAVIVSIVEARKQLLETWKSVKITPIFVKEKLVITDISETNTANEHTYLTDVQETVDDHFC